MKAKWIATFFYIILFTTETAYPQLYQPETGPYQITRITFSEPGLGTSANTPNRVKGIKKDEATLTRFIDSIVHISNETSTNIVFVNWKKNAVLIDVINNIFVWTCQWQLYPGVNIASNYKYKYMLQRRNGLLHEPGKGKIIANGYINNLFFISSELNYNKMIDIFNMQASVHIKIKPNIEINANTNVIYTARPGGRKLHRSKIPQSLWVIQGRYIF